MAAAMVFLSPICNNSPISIAQAIDIQKEQHCLTVLALGVMFQGETSFNQLQQLFTEDLQRNGTNSEEEMYQITLWEGKNAWFQGEIHSKGTVHTFGPRLQDEEIKLLAEFVKSQADQGRPNREINQD